MTVGWLVAHLAAKMEVKTVARKAGREVVLKDINAAGMLVERMVS